MARRSSSTLATPPGITEYRYAGRPGRPAMKASCSWPAKPEGTAWFRPIGVGFKDGYEELETGCRANCQVIAAVAVNRSATRNLVLACLRLRRG